MSFVTDFIGDTFFGGAERDAARAAAAGVSEGIGEQRRQFDITQEAFAPGVEAGDVSRERLLEFLGLRGAEAERAAVGGFQESPGQAFLRERGERAVLRNQSAIGGLGGGNVRRELQREGIGTAATQLGERKSRLAGVASGGGAAVAQQAGIGADISALISQLLGQRGAAEAGGILGQAQGRRSGLARVAGAFI